MLKKISGLFLGLVVLTGSACVTPTHASSATVIMTSIQAGGASGAKEELIVLYNPGAQAVNITGWCLVNKSIVMFACIEGGQYAGHQVMLQPLSYATIASTEYKNAHLYPEQYYANVFTVTNQSSGSIVGSADALLLVNAADEVVDSWSWTTSLASGKAWARLKLMTNPDMYAVTENASSNWSISAAQDPPVSTLELIENEAPGSEEPANGESETGSGQTGEGGSADGGSEPGEGSPQDDATGGNTILPPIITEVLANAAGSDTDNEFIELFNPNETDAILLDGIRLRVGNDSPKWYNFPAGATIAPLTYRAFYNSEVKFTLVNTTGKVQLYLGDTEPIGEPVEYSSPKDNESWAFINGVWAYTTVLTPGAVNNASSTDAIEDDGVAKTTTTKELCDANQYRNPATGRCKLISSSTSSPTPCKAGQQRNPETNRCRSVATAAKTLTPCKEGQERNPETNRCRNVTSMSDVAYKVNGVQTGANNQPRWYYWLAIAAIIALVLGYAIWEWREELKTLWRRIMQGYRRRKVS